MIDPVDTPTLGVLFTLLLVGLVLYGTAHRLAHSRPGFQVSKPLFVAFGLRLAAIAAINATGMGATLRGGDETTFLDYAQQLANQPLGHGDLPHGLYQLHTVIFALEIKTGFMNITAIRIVQIGLALLGALMMVAVAYDCGGGASGARLAAWLLALEPSSIFFASEIHRESLLEFAAGLTVLGGSWVWQRLDIRGILLGGLGCLIAIETRSYAGWFMAAGLTLIVLHAALRNITIKSRAIPIVFGVLVAVAIMTPTLLTATSGHNLRHLQASQQGNASGVGEQTGGANGTNLSLETVDYSSRGAVITSLPTKISDLVLQPYPWELRNSSEMFGAVGTLVVYVLIYLIVRVMWRSRGKIFERTGPLLYILITQTIAYALTVGNAGTGFRYRAHLTTLMIAIFATLHACVQHAQADESESVNNGSVAVRPRHQVASAA